MDEPLMYGPLRRAPMYYVGETYGKHRIQYPDVERLSNGRVSGTRNKLARRVIRAALKRRFSRVERGLELPRAMQAQARELADAQGPKIRDYSNGRPDHFVCTSRETRWARRLYAKELNIHTPVYVPSDLRAHRTAKRKLKRAGKADAISQLVDRMAK